MKKNVCILGGGISGLATAHFLRKKYKNEIDITLIEKNDRLGGWVQTKKKEGFLIERGPRGFRSSKESIQTLNLIHDLGIESKIIKSSDDAKVRYLLFKNSLERIPASLPKFFSSPLFKGIKRSFIKELFTKPCISKDESIHQFFERHFSAAFADRFISAFTYGVFAGDSKALSVRSCFPNLYRMDQSYGSIIKGFIKEKKKDPFPKKFQQYRRAGLLNFKDGMHTLIESLESCFHGKIFKGTQISSLCKNGSKYLLKTSKGDIEASHIISCLPLPELSALLDQNLQAKTPNIPRASLSLVSLGFTKNRISMPKGYGYLIPKDENAPIYGSVWDSQVFPEQNKKQLLTVFVPYSEKDPERLAIKSLEKHLHTMIDPDFIEVSKAPSCIAHFPLHFETQRDSFLEEVKLSHPHLTLSGASLYGPAINQCVKRAHDVASAF